MSEKQKEGEKDKLKRQATRIQLTALVGKSVGKMTKAEQETLLIVIGQQIGLLDEKGVVKALSPSFLNNKIWSRIAGRLSELSFFRPANKPVPLLT